MRRAWLVTLLSLLCSAALAQQIRAPYQALSDSITRIMGLAPTDGNSVLTYRSGEAFIAALLEEIGAAKESVDLEYYWMDDDDVGRPVRDALIRKAGEGVRVRVIVDNLIVPMLPESYFRKMEKAGVALHYHTEFKKKRLWELPGTLLGERDHRKIVVVDGRVCYTGGMNLCDHILEWEDTHMRIEGKAAVSMTALFDLMWQRLSGEQPAEPPSPVASPNGQIVAQMVYGDGSSTLEEVYIQVLENVQHYIYFRSPYLVPPPRLLQALGDACRRGVDVRILMPQASDWPFMNDITRYYFESLHESGVRLYTYPLAYDHSKCFVADDYLSSCGTVNLDNRSFYINCENTVFFYDEDLAREALADFMDMLSRAQEVTASDSQIIGLRKTWVNFLLSIAPIL